MAITLRIVGSLGESLANRKLDPVDYFRVARDSLTIWKCVHGAQLRNQKQARKGAR